MFRYHSIAPERIKEETVGGHDHKRYQYKSKQAALLFQIIFTELTQALIITQYQKTPHSYIWTILF